MVTATRTPQPPEHVASAIHRFDENALRATPTATLDGLLRSVPGFSLFRRSDSFTANPTAQGVSLRGLGPSGASRSLVLLDGVPLNDPFGGWVAWTKVPREGLARVEVIPGGGATAWGNAALGGVLQLFSHSINAETERAAFSFRADLGDFSTRSIEFETVIPTAAGTLQVLGRTFATDGFSLVSPERRGPIDIAAESRHSWLTLRWHQLLTATTRLTATVRGFEESRGNGTPYQRNESREKFTSLALFGQPTGNFAWDAAVYAQDQSYASTFSAVNATRTAETPASDQFAVPAVALGAAWSGVWQHDAHRRTSGGTDLRFVRGETQEAYTYTNGNFTRQRIAGGEQSGAGIFALHEQALAPQLRAILGARLDAWRETDGHRRETDRATGTVLRDDHYEDRHGLAFNPSAGLVWQPHALWRLRANTQQAFRRPTLNELYRPFRQGANVTETNAELRTERATSAEVGAEWSWLPSPATPASPAPLTLGITAFWNNLRDAVGNVTVARGPGTFPLFGTLPAGGIGRQRLNLDRTRVQGWELTARWQPSAVVSFEAAALFNDATVRRAHVAPSLVGKRLAQVPRHSATLGASVHLPGGFTFVPRLRWLGRQFEDDENALRLGEVVVIDLGLTRRITPHLDFFVTVENSTDARMETGRSADGLVNLGTPRLGFAGLRGRW